MPNWLKPIVGAAEQLAGQTAGDTPARPPLTAALRRAVMEAVEAYLDRIQNKGAWRTVCPLCGKSLMVALQPDYTRRVVCSWWQCAAYVKGGDGYLSWTLEEYVALLEARDVPLGDVLGAGGDRQLDLGL